MITIEKLKNFGCDTEQGIKNCMDSENLYLILVESFVPDTRIDKLIETLIAGNLVEGFGLAVAEKGIYSHLAITPLATRFAQLSELLRGKANMDYAPLLGEIKYTYDSFLELFK